VPALDFYQVTDGEGILIPLNQGGHDACCDCGLVHKVRYSLVTVSGTGKQFLVQTSTRDDKETAKMRKAKRHEMVKRRKN
jgi:hypothetical protein